MKKYIIGALIGFVLSLGVGAHAEVVTMIGKVIDGSFPIKIKGVTLQNPALTIDGVSYVPTREFAESLGATVKFDANLGIEVVPVTPPTPTTSPIPSPAPSPPTMTKAQKIDQLKNNIEVLKTRIYADKGGIEMNKDTPDLPIVVTWKETVVKNEKELADLQSQLTALQSQP